MVKYDKLEFKDSEEFPINIIRKFVLSDKKLREKQQLKLAEMIQGSLSENGKFYWSEDVKEAYFFYKDQKKIYTIGMPEFAALCYTIYKLNTTRPFWKFLECHLNAEASLYAERTKMHISSFYNKKEKLLYVQNGVSHMFKLDGFNDPELIDNGSDGVLFKDNNMEGFEVDYKFEGSPIDKHLIDIISNTVEGQENILDLYKLYIHSIFFESIMPTKMCLLLTGQAGSGKSSGARALLRVLFGPDADVENEPDDKPDFFSAVTNSNVVCFDNADDYVGWFGNALAMACTGGTYSRRALYTNNGNVRYPIKCFIIITSRSSTSFKREDIAERLLLIELYQHKPGTFQLQENMSEALLSNRNKIWGELLLNLNKIVQSLMGGTTNEKQMIRMADFAGFCATAGQALGIENTLRVFQRLEDKKSGFIFEHSPVFEGISKWVEMGKNSGKRISTGDLFKEVSQIYDAERIKYPIKSAGSFGIQLKSTAEKMNQWFKIEIELNRNGNKTYVTITPKYEIEELEHEQIDLM